MSLIYFNDIFCLWHEISHGNVIDRFRYIHLLKWTFLRPYPSSNNHPNVFSHPDVLSCATARTNQACVCLEVFNKLQHTAAREALLVTWRSCALDGRSGSALGTRQPRITCLATLRPAILWHCVAADGAGHYTGLGHWVAAIYKPAAARLCSLMDSSIYGKNIINAISVMMNHAHA